MQLPSVLQATFPFTVTVFTFVLGWMFARQTNTRGESPINAFNFWTACLVSSIIAGPSWVVLISPGYGTVAFITCLAFGIAQFAPQDGKWLGAIQNFVIWFLAIVMCLVAWITVLLRDRLNPASFM